MEVRKLSAEFPHHKFEFCKLPLFLQGILNIKDDIILCYNVANKREATSMQNYNLESFSNFSVTESLYEGSPLELPSCIETSLLNLTVSDVVKTSVKYSSIYSPLTSDQALIVKGFYNLKVKSAVPLVILCAGDVKLVVNDKLKTVNRVVHCSYQSGSNKTTCWSDYYKIESCSVETLDDLYQMHLKKVNVSNDKKNQCNIVVRSKTILMSTLDVNEVTEKCSSVSACFQWKTLSLKPPLDGTDVSLIVDICLTKAPTISLRFIWKQLELMQKYLDFVSKNSNSKNSSILSAKAFLKEFGIADSKLDKGSVDIEILKICENMRHFSSLSKNEKSTVSKLIDFFSNPNSQSSDFTNSLWIKLIGCESYELLLMCFKHFFNHARQTAELKLVINSTYQISRLSHAIQDKMVLDSYLQMINPVEYLLEIGLEKLLQVVLNIFKSMKVSISSLNMPTLPKFSEVKSGDEWLKVSGSWLAWLSRLYASLNIICSVEQALGNPSLAAFYPIMMNVVSEVCSNSRESTFKIDSVVDLLQNPQRNIVLKTSMNILNSFLVDTDFLDEWILTLTSSNNARTATSIFYRSPSCPLPYINDDSFDGNNLINSTQPCQTYSNTTISSDTTVCLDYLTCPLHCIETHILCDYVPFLKSK